MWIQAANENEIADGQWKEIESDDFLLLLIRYNGTYYAIENVCTHDGGTLSDGTLESDEIVCPRHGARFCIKTGEVTAPPAYEDIQSFPVKIENGHVWIEV